jgi:DNA-cytosine methyltransferase
MNVLSLFDGFGGARIALMQAGIPVANYYASEIDKYATKVSQANYPDIRQLKDINNFSIGEGGWWFNFAFGTTPTITNLPKIDLIIMGSPCQDLSFAGKQKGLKGERSGLLYKAIDIINYYKPQYFIAENVCMSKATQDIFSELLGVEPVMINSALVTAQSRKRLYWVGKLVNGKYEKVDIKQPRDKNIVLKEIIEDGWVDRVKSYCLDANYWKGGNLTSYFGKRRRQLVFCYPDIYSDYRKLTPLECERLQGLPDNYTNQGVSDTQRYKMIGNGFTIPMIKHILETILKLGGDYDLG